MQDDSSPLETEYQDADISVVSSEPLIGMLELVGADDQQIEVRLDLESAESLISALVQFLAEGDDAPNISAHTQQ
jgi:hypothetical protein